MMVIYKITNSKNNKIYIGSTKNFEKRKKQHIYLMKNNKHHSVYLQNFYNKYNDVSFSFKILKIVNSKEDLLKLEQHFIDTYKSYNPKFGFNEAKVVKNSSIYKPVYQYDCKGNFLKKFEDVTLVATTFNMSKDSIYRALKLKVKIKNFYFSYEKKKILKVNNFYYVQYNKKGDFIKSYNSLKEIKEKIPNVNKSNIIEAIKNRILAYNFYWVKYDFYIFPKQINIKLKKTVSKVVFQFDKKTKKLIKRYNSLTEASILTGISISSISRCLSKSEKLTYYKSTRNFIWAWEPLISDD